MILKNKIKYSFLNAITVTQIFGYPSLQTKSLDEVIKIQTKVKIEKDFYLKTDANSFLTLDIDGQYELIIMPNSLVTSEGTQKKDSYDLDSLDLKKGQIYLKSLKTTENNESEDADFKLKSDFFSWQINSKESISVLIDIDKKKGQLFVCNAANEFKLSLFNHEVSPVLSKEKGIKFNGVVNENEEIQYDFLLESRKVPKGKWDKIESCNLSALESAQKKLKNVQNEKKNKVIQTEKMNQKQKAEKDSKFLCHEPYGNLDQCSYLFKSDKCIRMRCNAEGKWADSIEVSLQKNLCTKKIRVTACDY